MPGKQLNPVSAANDVTTGRSQLHLEMSTTAPMRIP